MGVVGSEGVVGVKGVEGSEGVVGVKGVMGVMGVVGVEGVEGVSGLVVVSFKSTPGVEGDISLPEFGSGGRETGAISPDESNHWPSLFMV